MYSVTIQRHFDAAHHLRGYKGPCSRNHGHRFSVQVTVEGEHLDKLGMLVDYKELKDGLDRCLEELDHRDLNTIPPWHIDTIGHNPTAESIAEYIYGWMEGVLSDIGNRNLILTKVRVYESPDCYSEYWE